MRREDLSVPALLAEAVGIVVGLVYIVLQIFYGVKFHLTWQKPAMNIVLAVLVYAALTLLSVYPERVNGLSDRQCRGAVRKYTIRMVRLIKLVFMASLMVPCVCDVSGHTVKGVYTAAVIGLLLLIAGYYEYRIIAQLRDDNRKDKS